MAQDLDYIPMPDNVTKLVEAMWDEGHPAEIIGPRAAPAASPSRRSAGSPLRTTRKVETNI